MGGDKTTNEAYLTIDDSPTPQTDTLTDWLVTNDIPAVLFCIGSTSVDLNVQRYGMAENPAPIARAIDKGFLIGNHTYHHHRASELPFEAVIAEIEKTEKLIEAFYRAAGKGRAHKMIRFPHIDRGTGAEVVDYARAGKHGDMLKTLFHGGLNVRIIPPTAEQIDKRGRIQNYLKAEGYGADGFARVDFDWYQETEMREARDALITVSTSDWMLNPDFDPALTKDWPCKTLDELKSCLDSDLPLKDRRGRHIVLAHDHNNLFDVTTGLVTHLRDAHKLQFINV